MITRIWEHWEQSGKPISEYVDWLEQEQGKTITLLSFQRTARHHKVAHKCQRPRPGGGVRQYIVERKLGQRQLELLDAVYARFGRHYGWLKPRA